MSFASLEDRANAAVIKRLSNARALKVGAAQDFPIIFDRAFVDTGAGVGGTMPMFDALSTDLAGVVPHATQVVIDGGTTYKVLDLQPDGTGFTKVLLEVA